MSTTNNMTDIRSSSLILDGRRPTAPGNDISAHWAKEYERARRLYVSNLPYWSSDQWAREYKDAPNYRKGWDQPGFMDALWDLYQQALVREERSTQVTEARDRLKKALGPREFTLTYSPAWFLDDDTAKDAMRVAIDKLTRYYKDDIIEFHAVGEYTEAGRAHVHCYYELDGGHKITDKNFKRAWSFWDPRKKLGQGHQGGHHANVRSKSDFLGYIEKDLNTAWMNVHINNADDDKTSHGSRDSQELRSDGGEKDV